MRMAGADPAGNTVSVVRSLRAIWTDQGAMTTTATISPAGQAGGNFAIGRLLDPAAFPHAVTHLRLVETHISWIVLTGHYAYKLKKPVRFPFIDASTLARRLELCQEELRLNRRMAPDLYEDVVPIVLDGDQPRVGGSGTPVEYAVRMHEFERSQELAALLPQGAVSEHDVTELAATLADFHRRAAVAGAQNAYGAFPTVSQEVLSNLALLERYLETDAEEQAFKALARWTRENLHHLEAVIRRRKDMGAIRECHGDLHARNIVRWRQRWTPYDCVEFDPALRWIDVMSDLGFLFMDVAAYRRADLAFACLSRYLEVTGDYDGLTVLPFYAVYRALVRAKVDALGAAEAGPETARALHARLVNRLDVALRLTAQRRPALVVMHGVTACGKSWLSERLIPAVHAVRVRADLERKRMSGVAPLAHRDFGVLEGPYAAIATQRTYARLLECAASALDAGFNLIADASFLDAAQREAFHALALRFDCVFLIVSCQADRAALDARLAARARIGLDPSEATAAVLEHQLATQQPLTDRELAHCVRIDTTWLTSADDGVRSVAARLGSNRLV
jgi:aminoglycoside phosphotransferase family enzyme/predicted kinase